MKKKERTETSAPEELSWSAAEHEYTEKDITWYLAIGGLALLLLIIAIWQGNYFFAVFVVLAGIVLANFGKRRPKVFEFRVTGEGVGIGEKFLAFDQLESFMLRERQGSLHELIVKQKTYVNPYLRIPVDGETAERARALLAAKLPEEEYQVSLLDVFADWLGL
jgi:hypothetical protein